MILLERQQPAAGSPAFRLGARTEYTPFPASLAALGVPLNEASFHRPYFVRLRLRGRDETRARAAVWGKWNKETC